MKSFELLPNLRRDTHAQITMGRGAKIADATHFDELRNYVLVLRRQTMGMLWAKLWKLFGKEGEYLSRVLG